MMLTDLTLSDFVGVLLIPNCSTLFVDKFQIHPDHPSSVICDFVNMKDYFSVDPLVLNGEPVGNPGYPNSGNIVLEVKIYLCQSENVYLL